MTFLTPSLRTLLAAVALGGTLAAGAALGAEPDYSTRIERLGQGIERLGKNIGRRLDVTQLFNRPPPEPDEEEPGRPRDPGALSVRLDRVEGQLRALTGLVEQLQHDMRRLEELARRAEAPGAPTPQRSGAATPEPMGTGLAAAPAPAAGLRRNDAFDPGREPGAPGAPRPLGTTAPSAPLAVGGPAGAPATTASDLRSPGQPLDLTHGRLTEAPPPPAAPIAQQSAALPAVPTTPQSPRDEYDAALARLRLGEYQAAEKGFSDFLERNPKSRLTPLAVFNLGETFFLRGRHREAAEKYLEITTKYATSSQAPEAMLRLGQSLHAIGAKEQACASFSEVAVKYPSAPSRVKEAAQRESKKVQC